ncbi:MAG: HD domain-containing protein [Chitinivibrionia bacterium]|nr:HD domain-containing protein [Chitinivibrionia bacterium]
MDKETAINLLEWAGIKNPGKWIDHSYNVAKAAEKIAAECSLDKNFAYILGLLHDIGRYEGITNLRHVYAGYILMKEKGYENIAKICLTHSFPDKNIKSFYGNIDCTSEEIDFLENELKKIEYDDYDKLIQLCDALCTAEGITLIEIRIVDVAKRYGFNEYTQNKWNAFFDIKNYFENKYKINIYGIFKKEIIESIFKA